MAFLPWPQTLQRRARSGRRRRRRRGRRVRAAPGRWPASSTTRAGRAWPPAGSACCTPAGRHRRPRRAGSDEAATRCSRVSDRYQWVPRTRAGRHDRHRARPRRPERARPLVTALASLAARCDMRELVVRAYLHRAPARRRQRAGLRPPARRRHRQPRPGRPDESGLSVRYPTRFGSQTVPHTALTFSESSKPHDAASPSWGNTRNDKHRDRLRDHQEGPAGRLGDRRLPAGRQHAADHRRAAGRGRRRTGRAEGAGRRLRPGQRRDGRGPPVRRRDRRRLRRQPAGAGPRAGGGRAPAGRRSSRATPRTCRCRRLVRPDASARSASCSRRTTSRPPTSWSG